jgi:hypothetical protein
MHESREFFILSAGRKNKYREYNDAIDEKFTVS